ncbi:DUF1566 domain-containing protein [Pseudomonas sp. Irchel 3A18]|uniref:DUF1566 domain-containing protein n=1 Tax=Pseudomonas sp. Irchel 3A18 TaxID=2008905 RepID=UPI00211441CD|nr:DUF1566 domain-containing protein [Pseudomonas sp. Irchel 3A18]
MNPVFHIKEVNINIHAYQRAPALVALGAAFAAAAASPTPDPVESVDIAIPAHGEYWPGEGGKNGGFVPARGDVPAHYLIFASEDLSGKFKWGGREKESAAISKTDGRFNTDALLSEGDHPAAEAAAKYTADGHEDFYLAAPAELYQGWLNCPDIFSKSDWYWSSSQRSAYSAFTLHFGGGNQHYYGKGNECFVRPVRRKFIQ